jgi:hypothetical protein
LYFYEWLKLQIELTKIKKLLELLESVEKSFVRSKIKDARGTLTFKKTLSGAVTPSLFNQSMRE